MAEVKFKFVGDDSELRKKLANIAKMQSEMSEKFSANLAKTLQEGNSGHFKRMAKEASDTAREVEAINKAGADRTMVNATLGNIEALRQARIELSKQLKSQSDLSNQYTQGKIDLQTFRFEQAKLNAERKEQARIDRELKKNLSENSEYGKLAKALNTVRKEAKEVQAEMFRMERQGHANTLGYEALRKKAEGLTKQTQYLDQGIKKIDASLGQHQRNVGNYGSAIEVLGPQFDSINEKLALFGTSIDDLAGKPGAIKELGASFVSVGKGILSFLLSPIGLAITALTGLFMLFKGNKQTVIDFNNGMLNVSKTTGMSGDALKVLSDDVIQLSRSLKTVSTNKLTEYASIAGQLGVKGRSDILAFTDALAQLETASDISGEEGGKEIARLLTLVDGGVQNVRDFGDEIVNLGNNFAASEKEILSNAESISQNVGLYRMGRQDVLAYATATKALGVEAEVVGSTFQKTLGSFEKSIRSGKGLSDILKVVGGSAADLQARFKTDASGVFQDYIKGLNAIHKAGGSVNAQMERNGITDIRQRRVIGTLAAGYDTLARAMGTAKDATGAMQEEFDTAAGKLVNQSQRIGIAWDNLVLSVEDGTGVIGKSSVAIVGFFADIIDSAATAEGRLNKLFSSKFFSEEFWLRVSSLSTAPIEYFLGTNASGEEADKVKLDYDRMTSRRSKHYNQNLDFGKSTYKYFERKEKGLVNDGKPGAVNSAVSEEEESEKDKLNREKAAEAANRKAEKAAEDRRQSQERQRALQLSIDQISDQVTRNNLSRDDQELASIKDKYAKIREEVRKFYDDPKNKGQKVDTGKLPGLERFETEEAERRILNRATLAEIEDRKALYEQFEQYKLDIGLEKAQELMKGQIDTSKSYLQFLEEELGKATLIDPTIMTAAQKELFEAVAKVGRDASLEAKKREEREQVDLLKLMETYGQKRSKLISDFEKNRKRIVDTASAEELRVFDSKHVEELNSLDDANIQKLDSYKRLFEGIEKLSDSQARAIVNNAKALLSGGFDMSPELRKQITEALKTADKSISERLHERTSKVAEEFSRMAGFIGDANKELADMLGLLSNVLRASVDIGSGFGDLTKALDNYKKNKSEGGGGLLGDLAAIAGVAGPVGRIVGAVAGVVTGLFTIGKRTKEMNRQARAEVQNFYDAAIRGELDYQALLRRRELDTAARGENSYRAIVAQLEVLKKQSPEIEKAYNKIFSALQGQEFVDGQGYKHGTWLRKAKTWDIMASLGGSDYAELEKLYTQGKLKDKAKADFEALKSLKQELDGLGLSIEDLQNDLNQLLTGTSSSSLASGLSDLFASGKRAAKDFGDSFEEIMKNALKASFQAKFLEDAMAPFYEELAKMMEGGDLSVEQIDKLRQKYTAIGEENAKKWEELEKITGIDISGKEKQGELSKGIAGITESTANRLEAEFGGLRLAQLELLQVAKGQGVTLGQQLYVATSQLSELVAIQNNTYRTANNTDRLASIEGALISMNSKMSSNDAARRGAGL
ncbi:phage tail tape measure protein [Sphingobacterium psychroaquaticum]|uniref:Phage tail tape measure protein, TP901 family, core region n=1 Tax=Sphingobacterium psychroaquaticum TaxID=561061 RepID=A0A1X7JW39_9SPHI|nr:phage tail tape measure protein [Sphingobacterium psychroaquaticum]SMG32455.1 phage tail tape measure protein, TP901 family, core region [Sphingobacterium psychroaquaticum]